MADPVLKAIIHIAKGHGSVHEYPVQRVEAYAFEAQMDEDQDSFSIDIGDPDKKLISATHRDNEVRATIFAFSSRGKQVPVFSGIADRVTLSSDDEVLSISGSDQSSLALGDAPPGRFYSIEPASFIKKRAASVGMQVNRIHRMGQIGTLYTDGSESEWALWYRIARSRGMFMWTEPLGGLVVDHLAYELRPSYNIGFPPHGAASGSWIRPTRVEIESDKSRQGEVWVYSLDDKTAVSHVARGIDTSIRGWRRKPIRILQSQTAKSQKDAKKEADQEIFESIVGKQEIVVDIDASFLVKQNRMVRLNIPEFDLVGTYFVVGVQDKGSMTEKTQTLRLREKDFALSKRVPRPPTLVKDTARSKVTSQVGRILSNPEFGVKWGDSFMRATNEFGVKAGWDTAIFLTALLAICDVESSFHNVREGSHEEWKALPDWMHDHADAMTTTGAREAWYNAFANKQHNPRNPRSPSSESGVGPMQLTTPSYKDWADAYGWNGTAKVGEYDGGRWNPDSNIRAAARALVEKGQVAPRVDPSVAANIWIAVSRYHGSTDASNNAAYVAKAKKAAANYSSLVGSALATSDTKNVGTDRTFTIIGYGPMKLPVDTPDDVVKAINFCMNRRGDRYQWDGHGPYYDCSSLVTAAYASASAHWRAVLDEPDATHHGENTYTLFQSGRFLKVQRDNLLPGDLVFFHHDGGLSPEHVGMYLQDNMMVHDPKTGDVVKVSNLSEQWYADHYIGARRLSDWSSSSSAHPVP